MLNTLRLLALTLMTLVAPTLYAQTSPSDAGFWTTPTIAGYGRIHVPEHSAYLPDPKKTYKVVFSITTSVKDPSSVNHALDHVARAVNLYVAAGVPLSHLKFVAIIYGAATPLALDDAHFQSEFHVANPNLALIAELKKAGVDVAVCAQAVAENQYEYSWVDPSVTLALSGLTTVTGLQQQGYALMPM